MLSRAKAGTHSPFGERSHTAAHTAKQGPFLPRPQHGFVLSVKSLLFHRAFIYIHFPVLCEPPLSAEGKLRQSCCHKFYSQPFLIAFFNFSHKWPAFAFTGKSGYTLGFPRKIAHNGPHAETGVISDGGGITTLGAFRTFTNIPGPGIRTASFAAFGAWSRVLSKNAESLRNSDALMRVAVPRHRGPAGLRSLLPLFVQHDLLGWKDLTKRSGRVTITRNNRTGQPFGACVGAASGGKMRAITLDFKESHHGRT